MGSIKGQKHNPYIEGRYAHINQNDVVFTLTWLRAKTTKMDCSSEIIKVVSMDGQSKFMVV